MSGYNTELLTTVFPILYKNICLIQPLGTVPSYATALAGLLGYKKIIFSGVDFGGSEKETRSTFATTNSGEKFDLNINGTKTNRTFLSYKERMVTLTSSMEKTGIEFYRLWPSGLLDFPIYNEEV